jgi:hypothetical protein
VLSTGYGGGGAWGHAKTTSRACFGATLGRATIVLLSAGFSHT